MAPDELQNLTAWMNRAKHWGMNLPVFTLEIHDLQAYTQQRSLRLPGCTSIVNRFLSQGDLINISISVSAGATP